MELPAAFLSRMETLLGDEFAGFYQSFKLPASAGLRANLLKITSIELQSLLPFNLEPLAGCPEGFLLVGDDQPGKHPYHAAGLYYLQDPSAMLVSMVLDPQPGERVLDLCAAPGGKATHIAVRMRNQGLFVANEIHAARAWELAENLERWGVRNVTITNETPAHLSAAFPAFFDRVLVDAPCSGEGMFRKSDTARGEWAPGLVQSCALRQTMILSDAAKMVRPGGRLVYSTCTFNPEENEGTVGRFLRDHPGFELLPAPEIPGASPGRPEWLETGPRQVDMAFTIRLWPHLSPGEGHFIAQFQRIDDPDEFTPPPARLPRLPAEIQRVWRAFVDKTLAFQPDFQRLALRGSYIYQLPAGLPELGRLKVIHPGWWLGTRKTNRCEPAQALAMALTKDEARQSVCLKPGEAVDYLHGQSLALPGEEGWVLMTVDGFPLGWGKRVNGVVKNFYPRGLRWL